VLAGSKIARGRKKRRNIKKHVVRNPTTLAQTMRRRILFTGGSGVLSTIAAGGFVAGFAVSGGVLTTGAVGGGGATVDTLDLVCGSAARFAVRSSLTSLSNMQSSVESL